MQGKNKGINQERCFVEDDYVEGLTGEEIINDLLDKVAEKLRSDCNLRETDAYTGGYNGSVKVHLILHGLDAAEVKTEIAVSAPATEDFPVDGESPVIDTEVDTEFEIPLEPRLNLVRGQDVPTLGKNEEGTVVVKKRHYAKKQK
jgi:hypothetical protein